MISIRRVTIGGGYRYLINSVAAGDGNPEPSKVSLTTTPPRAPPRGLPRRRTWPTCMAGKGSRRARR